MSDDIFTNSFTMNTITNDLGILTICCHIKFMAFWGRLYLVDVIAMTNYGLTNEFYIIKVAY